MEYYPTHLTDAEIIESLVVTEMLYQEALKNGKAKTIKLETLSKICEVLQCQPGDVLEYVPGETEEE